MWAKIINDVVVAYPYGPMQLKLDNPMVSFPDTIGSATLNEWDVYEVEPVDPPAFDSVRQNCVRSTPTKVNGVWVETWELIDASPEEIEARVLEKATEVRAQRNQLLEQTDWCALSDVVMSQEMATYRQALRDITSQDGFPLDVVWPTL